MKLSDYDYDLPSKLIAQSPLEKRDDSKLLILDRETWKLKDKKFSNIFKYLWKDDVLVVNQTRVINARLKGKIEWKTEGKKECEIFLHKQISSDTWDCLVYPGKKIKVWKNITFDFGLIAIIENISISWRIVKFNKSWVEFLSLIDKIWEVPLPPYIKEKLGNSKRYQTVFNKISGSVAAPTAGLHFTDALLKKLEKEGVKIEKVLLHVWLWTFASVETENIKDHKMHSEYIEIDKETAERLNKYKKEWKRIIAVWTTSNRALESFTDQNGILWYWNKETNIFIYPWYKWKFVDSLITNFHLPKSTLIMLVSALAGRENIKKAYSHAIKHKYRFFSFWDAMWIR